MDNWNIKEQGNELIVTHSDGSGVVVKKEDNDRIAADILARLALDILKSQSKSQGDGSGFYERFMAYRKYQEDSALFKLPYLSFVEWKKRLGVPASQYFQCPDCSNKSYNLNDIEHQYCSVCKKFYN